MSEIERPIRPETMSFLNDNKGRKLTAKNDFVLLPQVQGG